MRTLFSVLAAAMMLTAGTYRFLTTRSGPGREARIADRGFWLTLGMMAVAFALLIAGQVLSNDG
jgi:hypothetical protein